MPFPWIAGAAPKSSSSGELRRRLFQERFKELRKVEAEIQAGLKNLDPELRERVRKNAAGVPGPLDEEKERTLTRKKRESAQKDLEEKAKRMSQKEVDEVKNRNERLAEKFLKSPGEKKPEKIKIKSASPSSPKPSGSTPPSRAFKKGIEKSPVEYGNSTAIPGEAEKEAIEYEGKPSRKKSKAKDPDQE